MKIDSRDDTNVPAQAIEDAEHSAGTTAALQRAHASSGVAPFQAVGFALSSIGHAVARLFRATLAPLELEPREFALLRAVGAAEGKSQQAIGEALLIPPSRMVAFVDALEARSLLERRHNPLDRRTRELHLTAQGRELLERAFVLAADLERDLCGELSAAEREQLTELLQRVGKRLNLPPTVHSRQVDGSIEECGRGD